ncbi:hypothetical protein JI750_17640 [Flavobacterium sp. GN10]|uniref:Peptidase S74 domain-containing protein n=1 Tax=Flavobacterium tagetis TaxID=2801336 RepID=A0ABS1KGW7_9FLAO|nr:hypothetical protein [Flavobacterium tagetis]MBL0738723.1 hypothetical protein [Flavobacterium tagetis]
MKNKLLSLFLFLGSYAAYSQVGIGTPMPNASSQLEVVAADKGVLIPKISLTGSTDATTIKNGNVNSLLVFNTSTISDIKPGYYYWYDNRWNRIVISNEITANPGTVIYNPNNQQFTYIDASGNTQVIDIAAIVKANETVTKLVNNGGGSYTYTNEVGTAVNIDVVGDVTSNFSTIVNNPAVTNIIQDIVNKTEGNVSFDSTTNQFTYVDASGNTQIVDISTIVKANETITTLDKDASNNGQYTYTSENATKTTIDVIADVVNNSSVILNNSNIVNQLTNIIKSNETLTSLVYDGTASTLTYIDEKAVSNVINLVDLVGNAETQTTLVYDPVAKTLTYNGESGTPTVINLVDLVGDSETVTTQNQNPTTGVITYTNEAGIATTAQVTSIDAGNILTVGTDGGSLLTQAALTNATTVSNTSAVNNLTTTVNGVTGTAVPIINTNETSLNGGDLITTINGVASTPLDLTPIITAATTNTLSLTGNMLTSTVNGVAATSDAVSGVSNASAVNTSTVTVNGVTSSGAPIINSNATSLTGANLTTTVNGVASTSLDLTPAIKAGETITTVTPIVNSGSVIATYTNEAGGTPVEIQQTVTKQSQDPATGIISFINEEGLSSDANVISTDPANIITVGPDGGALLTPTALAVATTVSNTSAVNSLSTTVNGVTGTTVPIINTNETSLNGGDLITTINGVASAPLDLTPIITAATTNTLSLTGNTLTSTVNGVVATSDAVSAVSNTSAINTSTITVNGITSSGAPIINSNAASLTGASLTTTVNGVASTALDLTPAIAAATTNTLTAVNGDLISTVNGVVTTPAVPVLIAADNGLTATNGNVQLGGNLIIPTTINTDSANTLALTGLMHGDPMNEILVTDPIGIIRTIKPVELNMNDWSINGNMGIQSQFNFLGTLDDANLVFKRNNTPAGRIETDNTAFGVNALNTNSTGVRNVAMGTSVLPVNTTGESNTALGNYTLFSNTTGSNNAASGTYALSTNTTGNFNTATGFLAMQENTSGDHNTTIGYSALASNQTGSNNTAVGSVAGGIGGFNGSGNTFIGNNANPTNGNPINNSTAIGNNSKVATSNSLVLGGIGTDAVNVGIGTDSPTNTIHIKPVTGVDPIRAEGLQVSVSGTNNIVVADASGVFRTVTPSSLIPATTVSNSSTLNSLTTTVNGVTGTAVNIVNSNTTSLTGASLTTTVNGVASTALDLTPAIAAATTNTLSLAGNTLTSTVNGVASTSDAVSGVSNASAVNTSTVTVNGITSTGAPIINSNATSLTGASLTTTVNGVASTALDLSPAIKASETLTTLTPIVTTGNTIATYTNEVGGTPVEAKETITSLKDVVTQVTDPFGQLFDVHTLTYTDETNTPNPIDLSVLVKGVETLTSLVYDGANHSLIYSDEDGNATEFKMVDLIGESETLTSLQVNAATGTLDYTDENKVLTPLDLGAAVKEPWYSTTTHTGATLNTEDIYTNGWVGIGYTTASGAPNEKLRVNGAISTVNTYYADYVFEDYFKGKSEIKADYKFKRLPEIEDYIKKHNHLPGITPINRLEKTKEGYAFNMSELSIQLLEKTEEIYLHIIEQNKAIEAKDKEIKELKEASKAMNLRLEKLEKLIAEKNN